jgi:hypothetical protein
MKTLSSSFCILLLLISACKKQEIKGPTGDPGVNGTGGNSLIQSSTIFSIDSTAWQLSSDNTIWQAVSAQTIVSQAVLDKGAVKVYMQLNNAWWELPYSIADQVTQFSFSLGHVNFVTHDVEGATPKRPSTKNYRVVVLLDSN